MEEVGSGYWRKTGCLLELVMSKPELLVATIVSVILYVLAIDYLMDVPVLGFFIAWVGWIIPAVFIYGLFGVK